MEKTTLYKLDSKGKQRQWSIEVKGVWSDEIQLVGTCTPPETQAPVGRIIIETGLVDGKKVEQVIDITEGKNLGKANATTPYTQAVSEAESRIEQQIRSGYVENIEDLKASGTLGSGIQSPMLAQKHDPTMKQSSSKSLEKMKIFGERIHVQPKLDGNRCIIRLYSEHVSDKIGEVNWAIRGTMYTRKGDVMPVQLQHLIDELKIWWGEISTKDDEIFLDGELFSDELSFNELNGHLKRKESQDLKQLAKIKYHLYDVMINMPYDKRYSYIEPFARNMKYVELIPSFEIEATDENIKEKLEEFLEQGYEGLMIRTLDKGYENKRTWQLCKVKLFEDSEFKILDLEEDTMGRLGFIVLELDEPAIDRDGKTVTTFKAGLSGVDHEEGKKMLLNKDSYIGKMATIEYFGKDVRPRFPKYKGIRQD